MRWQTIRVTFSWTIAEWSEHSSYQMGRVQRSIFLQVYSKEECARFLSKTLVNICSLALNVDKICSRVRRSFTRTSIQSRFRSLRPSYVTVRIAQWPCLNDKVLPCWRVLSSVSILVASIRRSAVNTRDIRIPISIRLFRSIRNHDRCICLLWLKAVSRRPKWWTALEIGETEMRFQLLRSHCRDEWEYDWFCVRSSSSYGSSAQRCDHLPAISITQDLSAEVVWIDRTSMSGTHHQKQSNRRYRWTATSKAFVSSVCQWCCSAY